MKNNSLTDATYLCEYTVMDEFTIGILTQCQGSRATGSKACKMMLKFASQMIVNISSLF